MTIDDDFEGIITERLKMCHAEIEGIIRSDELPPVKPLEIGELPATYNLLGPMLGKIPSAAIGAGQVVVGRQYIARLLLAPVGTAEEIEGVGAEAIYQARVFIKRFRNYYLNHPRLKPDAAGYQDLRLTQDVQFLDSGPVARNGPGGALYFAVDFQLDIYMRGFYSRLS